MNDRLKLAHEYALLAYFTGSSRDDAIRYGFDYADSLLAAAGEKDTTTAINVEAVRMGQAFEIEVITLRRKLATAEAELSRLRDDRNHWSQEATEMASRVKGPEDELSRLRRVVDGELATHECYIVSSGGASAVREWDRKIMAVRKRRGV